MARPSLFHHRKFRTLARRLGSRALAVGSLELLWAVANDAGDPLIGAAEDVEDVADWKGEAGQLVTALVACGFLDETADGLVVHDHDHHCPSYVRRRRDRERARRVTDEPVTRQQPASDASLTPTPISHLPSPITPHPEGDARAREDTRPPDAPALMSRRNEHAKHALCGTPCLPDVMWREMVEARQGDEAYVTAYVHRVQESMAAGAVPLDKFKFWRERWDADHRPKATARAAPAYRGLADWVCPHTPHCTARRGCEQRQQLDAARAASHTQEAPA